METVAEYHDKAAASLTAADASHDIRVTEYLIAQAAVYAELAKTARDKDEV